MAKDAVVRGSVSTVKVLKKYRYELEAKGVRIPKTQTLTGAGMDAPTYPLSNSMQKLTRPPAPSCVCVWFVGTLRCCAARGVARLLAVRPPHHL
mmetsp:Transcript_28941/g.70924  ORF Transcript_28941/g.70924 Transcript_28941/m.70924 type:complete len:94 (+) Transcript_28941:145-426(+)